MHGERFCNHGERLRVEERNGMHGEICRGRRCAWGGNLHIKGSLLDEGESLHGEQESEWRNESLH
jgi:hypothetical protein